MRLATTLLMVGVVLASLGTLPATAAPISLEASADAYGIWLGAYGYPADDPRIMDLNHGAAPEFLIKWNGDASSRKVWAKFDLSGVDLNSIAQATFQVTASYGPGEVTGERFIQVYALNDGDTGTSGEYGYLGEGWEEGGLDGGPSVGGNVLTWRNGPANIFDANEFDVTRTSHVGQVGPYMRDATSVAGTVYSMTSQELLDAVKGDTNGTLTLALLQTPTSGWSPAFATRENTTYAGPTLVLEVNSALAGDLNGDGFVGQDDLNIVLGDWGNMPPGDPRADPSGDGFVGQDDLNPVLADWGQGTPPPTFAGSSLSAAAVPEPSSILLLAMAIPCGLTLYRRHQRRAA